MRISLREPYKQFFGTLSNQVRLDIVSSLSKKEKTVSEIVKETKYEQSTVSHNLKRLKTCGFVFVEQKGKERIYSLNKKTIKPLLELMNKHMNAHCRHVVAKREGKKCHTCK